MISATPLNSSTNATDMLIVYAYRDLMETSTLVLNGSSNHNPVLYFDNDDDN